ncbi:hypothetical protein MD484_g3880, partial [Candolleomyces efflorescens]
MSAVVSKKAGNGYKCTWTPTEKDRDEYRDEPFPSALVDVGQHGAILEPITLRELTMLQFINRVTDKPEWTTKVFDETIIAKWEEETVWDSDSSPDTEMSQKMFNYCISELQHRAKEHLNSPRGAIRVFNGDVYKSDTAVAEETKLTLQKAIQVLEDVPESQKDWHPGSGGKLLDLVHPSLFPLVYGISKVLPVGAPITTLEDCITRCGEGNIIPVQTDSNHLSGKDTWSDKFQWLPCEVDISGEKPKITTYINNLHPQKHVELYHLVEDIIDACIPLWERTLVPTDELVDTPPRITYTTASWDPDYGTWDSDDQQYDSDNWPIYERKRATFEETRKVEQPEPPAQFEPFVLEREPSSLKEKYGSLPLQVIVKLANIELSPEKPKYEGGTWHVEGKRNESICATAIYYYSSENITPSSLAFRQQSAGHSLRDISYEQDEHDFLRDVFGLENWSDAIQVVGDIDTREGRLITFPNILQHQVQPFELLDPTKTGHRKILALFLRRDWWWDEMLKVTSTSESSKRSSVAEAKVSGAVGVHKLPPELQEIVFNDVDEFPIIMAEAKVYREQLMEERKKFVLSHQTEFAAQTISLCEH